MCNAKGVYVLLDMKRQSILHIINSSRVLVNPNFNHAFSELKLSLEASVPNGE